MGHRRHARRPRHPARLLVVVVVVVVVLLLLLLVVLLLPLQVRLCRHRCRQRGHFRQGRRRPFPLPQTSH